MSDIENEMLMGSDVALSDVAQRFEYEADMSELINTLGKEISRDNQNKGFYDDDFFMRGVAEILDDPVVRERFLQVWTTNRKLARIALMHTELSEAVEGIRKNAMDDKLPHRPMEEVELADALIRILDDAGAYNFDLGGAVVEKLNYNRTREYKHGKQV